MMEALTEELRVNGFARMTLDPFLQQQVAQAYACWAALFRSGRQKEIEGDAAIPIGYVALRSPGGLEMKESVYIQPSFALPGSVATPTKRLLRHLGRLAEEVADAVKHRLMSDKILYFPRHGCLRVMHYPPFEDHEEAMTMRSLACMGNLRAPPHTDLNALTFLPPATIGGLEVYHEERWLALEQPNELIILVGRELEAIGERSFPAAIHRVRNPNEHESHASRFAFAYFIS